MNTNTKIKLKEVWRMLKWTAVILVGLFFLLMLLRLPFFIQNKKTDEQVAKIHATKLTIDDVMGVNLPPDPGADADKTVAGIDANNNGIRDDVELAIFKEYPDSAKTRAVLLQYALALQMEMTQSMVNGGTVGAVSNIEDGAFFCLTKIVQGEDKQKNMTIIQRYENFLLDAQFNTVERKNTRDNFYEKLESGSVGEVKCDIDTEALPN